MFVKFMACGYPAQFEAFAKNLQEGGNFEAQFEKCFGCNASSMLQTFTGALRRP